MLAAIVVFVLVVLAIGGGYAAMSRVPALVARRRLARRLREVGESSHVAEASVVAQRREGPLPGIDRFFARGDTGSRLAKLIEQAGVGMSPSAIVLASVMTAVCLGIATQFVIRHPLALVVTVPIGAAAPTLWLLQRRSSRLKAFEEQFPEALELVSRAIRAGHAFQAAIGMVADELAEPVGPEFKKVFEQQNFGLPVREALNSLADRIPLVDVKFFVTAIAIQRETGGNLAEILDNLAHVVRERFKILRQVRVHTAHGRITGFVLLALPAFLAIALSFLNPEHMRPLFEERMGQMMLLGTVVMQLVGFIWIRHVIRIEV